jgi:hypothetical protein
MAADVEVYFIFNGSVDVITSINRIEDVDYAPFTGYTRWF